MTSRVPQPRTRGARLGLGVCLLRLAVLTALASPPFTRSDGESQITTNGVAHSSGAGVSFLRDPQGRIREIVDPLGRSLIYACDPLGNLASFTDRETNITTFAYTNTAFPHHLTGITDPRGVPALRTEYDDQGRMIRQIDADGQAVEFTHDLAANREIVRDRLGAVTVHEYDDRGNVVRTTDALGGVTRYEYDALDNQTAKIDALGNTNRFTYDPHGHRRTLRD